jgi:hypothetical protein
LVSLGIDNTSSIAANMIPVLLWYRHDMVLIVLSVLYHHDTDSGNFQKTLDLYNLSEAGAHPSVAPKPGNIGQG